MSWIDRMKGWMGGAAAAEAPEGPEWDALRTVIDPELGIDIVSLGLLREVTIDGDRAWVKMTLSTRGCPVGPEIVEAVREALADAGFVAEVDLVFEPPWSPDDMTAEARAALGVR